MNFIKNIVRYYTGLDLVVKELEKRVKKLENILHNSKVEIISNTCSYEIYEKHPFGGHCVYDQHGCGVNGYVCGNCRYRKEQHEMGYTRFS